ncbi:MAG: hypothetical protein ABI379_07970 [Rhodanobacter sp.]
MSSMVGALLLGSAALAGCATPPARNFGGSWKPANYFPEHPTEIPLNVAYTFYAAPMDGTLKTMLTRWAKDTKRELTYRAGIDITLYTPVSAIRTADINAAVAELSRIYAAQDVLVTATSRLIVVGPAGAATSEATSGTPAIATSQAPTSPRQR